LQDAKEARLELAKVAGTVAIGGKIMQLPEDQPRSSVAQTA